MEAELTPPPADELVAADCPLCSASERRVVHSGATDVFLGHPGRFDIVECTACAARYVDPRPVGEVLAGYYRDTDKRAYPNHQVGSDLDLPPTGCRHLLHAERGYPVPETGAPDARARREALAWLSDPDRTERILPWQGTGRLLDVGCGSGSYLAVCQALGWDVTGIDLFADVAAEVAKRLDVTCHAGELTDVDLPAGSFDVVTFWHVVEHLPDPGAILARAVELLAPGGLLAIGVPVYDCAEEELFGSAWLGYDVPRHLVTFSRPRLRSFLEELGLRVESMRSEPAGWVLKQGAKTVPLSFMQRQLLGHKLPRNWIARRLAARDRSAKVVALARKA
jgi:SAM-dependent methyltransferase